MTTKKSKLWLAAIASACLLWVSDKTHAQAGPMPNKQLSEPMEKVMKQVRTGETSTVRDEAAQHLAQLTHGINPMEVSDETITNLVSLLDLPIGRYWVARSLGNLGPRAKSAIPKLQSLLAEEDCRRVSKSAAGGIRYALARMGVKPPPTPTCDTQNK